ncbi:integrase arm-type DNA-binding domain-containing protein [Limibaculum sp. M0105]|uniref:Integrase arm-type DNA-binding domain-containing protein n=1 Tax=Thermohalobaculum xanthum TaxID=2753746 RepID=A0A8J7M736_9RHOB|nr:site-specific integrase [Thermohalobaculum xanthum]MBK0399503.1 integrase arm-type DNA-binding domain-containing protein [Thermohalobaculum xanthum]
MAKTLTAPAVERIKPTDKRQEVPDAALPGFYLIVQPSGGKSWAVRYRHNGKPRKLTLGAFPKLGLAAAREKAREALRTVSEGVDPSAKDKPDRDLFRAVADDFLRRHADKRKSADQIRRYFDVEILPVWGERRVDEITRRDVIDLLDAVVDRGAPVTANRVRAMLSRFFNWCVERDVIDASPCAGVKPPTEEKPRDRILTDDEIRWFWRATGRMGYPFGNLFQFLLLTGQRRGEGAAMSVAEVTGNEWHLTRDRTKKDRAHVVPLSAQALAVIDGLPRFGAYYFSANGRTPVAGFPKPTARLRSLMAEEAGKDGHHEDIPRFTVHDLRRTAASGMARCGARLEVIERAQNRVSGMFRGVAGVYVRYSYGDEIRHALDAWGALVEQIVTRAPGGNVVSWRGV